MIHNNLILFFYLYTFHSIQTFHSFKTFHYPFQTFHKNKDFEIIRKPLFIHETYTNNFIHKKQTFYEMVKNKQETHNITNKIIYRKYPCESNSDCPFPTICLKKNEKDLVGDCVIIDSK